jgi:hypothetical protein
LLTLEGHRNVVYAIAFNNPYGDKIITGSFGKIALPISAYRIIMSIVLIVVNSCAT